MFNFLNKTYLVTASWLASALIVFTVFYSCIFPYLPYLEGKFRPVTVDATIESVQPAGDGNSLVGLTFENLRQCRYVNLTWFQEDPDGRLKSVFVNFLDDTNFGSRGVGKHRSQTWYVKMPSDLVNDHSLVRVEHDCHPLWNTVTQIIPRQ